MTSMAVTPAAARGRGRSKARRKVSAIIACYRDAEAVPILHQRLVSVFEKLGVEFEIVFVNDASPDNAAEVLAGLASRDPRVVVINHTRNFGSQSAFSSGMEVATGDAVVLMDGDGQDPPELIESFYSKWLEGFEVVYGVRVEREASRFLRTAYKAFYRLFRATAYVNMPLDAGDFSLIDRRVVDVLNRMPENNRFVRGMRAWVGFKQTGIPYHRPERLFGRTTNSLIRNVGWARKAIFSYSYVPLEAITVLALVMVLASFVAILVVIGIRIFDPNSVPNGFTTLIALTLFIGGIQLLCLGVIGSYLAHIYDEVKRRPAFIVDSILNDPRKGEPARPRSEAGSHSERAG